MVSKVYQKISTKRSSVSVAIKKVTFTTLAHKWLIA